MRDLNRLLFPGSIAFVGGRECDIAIRKTLALGFTGRLYAVNPMRASVGGLATVPSIADLPEAPDAAFVAIKREPAILALRDLARIGAGGAVVFASGFAETGAVALQDELVAAAAGMPFLGPNCNGYVNLLARAVLWADDHGGSAMARGIAIVSQSGNIAVNLTMLRRAVPVAAVFALGNQADVDVSQMIRALAEDPRIPVIGVHIEGLRDIPAFIAAAEIARARGKPIVALKTGRSETGARITQSHTASLAGQDAAYAALFARCGVARVATITGFAETLKFLFYGGPTAGRRLVSMSCSGGEAALVADLAAERDLVFPPFAPDTATRVQASLGELVGVGNPLDYQTYAWGDGVRLEAAFAAALSAGFDVGLLILDVPTVPGADPASWLVTAEAFARAAIGTGVRAALVATLPECLPEALAARLAEAGIAPMAGLDDALTAFAAAAAIGEAWARLEAVPAILPGRPVAVESFNLSEAAAKARLAAAGVAVPPGRLCAPAEALAVARDIGFPVVLKVSSETLTHKTESGGVALDLRSEAEVAAAAQRLGGMTGRILVERMARGAVAELLVGVTADAQFGLVLLLGAGGVLTELLADTATLLLPTDRAAVEAALGRLRVGRLIGGFRGKRGDREAAIEAILAIARLAEAEAATLLDLEVNPLLVMPEGQGVVAVDALMRRAAP